MTDGELLALLRSDYDWVWTCLGDTGVFPAFAVIYSDAGHQTIMTPDGSVESVRAELVSLLTQQPAATLAVFAMHESEHIVSVHVETAAGESKLVQTPYAIFDGGRLEIGAHTIAETPSRFLPPGD